MQSRPVLTLTDARRALDTMRTLAGNYVDAHPGAGAVLVVVDDHGELILLERMNNAPFTSITIATNKAYSAARERTPSAKLGEIGMAGMRGEQNFQFGFFGDARMIGWGGGMPILVDGQCVGAVAVSGLPEKVDIEIATAGAAAAALS
jgi:glc operon protein GlcG